MLRVYIAESSKVDKKSIRHIFGWGEQHVSLVGEEQQLLKELSWKVKKMLRDHSKEKPEGRNSSASRYKNEFDDGR